MENKKQENNFRFCVYLRSEKIAEKMFSADLYNPVVRYSVNIREMIPSIIAQLQDVLQAKNEELELEHICGYDYNTIEFYKYICDVNDLDHFKLKVPPHYVKNNPVSGKPYPQKGGTEFKFGLYINSHPIVERNFYVDNYNPISRFSDQFDTVVRFQVEKIETHLKNTDVNQMWDDWLIINTYNLNIQQVREFSKEKREELLNRISDYSFVEKIRSDYSKQQQPQEAVS